MLLGSPHDFEGTFLNVWGHDYLGHLTMGLVLLISNKNDVLTAIPSQAWPTSALPKAEYLFFGGGQRSNVLKNGFVMPERSGLGCSRVHCYRQKPQKPGN